MPIIRKAYAIPFWVEDGEIYILVGVQKERFRKGISSKQSKYPYTFSFLGGTCEEGENFKQCLIREFYEETTGFLSLAAEDLNKEKTLSFSYRINNKNISIYVFPLPNLKELAETMNHNYMPNRQLPAEFLEYSFVKAVPLSHLLKLPIIYHGDYVLQQPMKKKQWSEMADEYAKLKMEDRTYEGFWFMSRQALEKAIRRLESHSYS